MGYSAGEGCLWAIVLVRGACGLQCWRGVPVGYSAGEGCLWATVLARGACGL